MVRKNTTTHIKHSAYPPRIPLAVYFALHTCYGQKKYNNSHKTFRVSTQNTARGLFCTSHLLW